MSYYTGYKNVLDLLKMNMNGKYHQQKQTIQTSLRAGYLTVHDSAVNPGSYAQ